jgi:ethanolamine-phosphate cytidylyltransferase
LTDTILAGVCSDADILKTKGPTVLNIDERMKVMTSCKWVGECIADTPYYVDEGLLEKFKCDFYLHGDDPCFSADGINICEEL